jgi:ribonuclease Z
MIPTTTKARGLSRGSFGTCILLPSYGLALDMGRCPEPAVRYDTVLLSHGHMDHIGGLGHHCARRELMRLPPPTYVMAPHLVEPIEAVLAAYRALDGSKLKYDRIIVEPGDEFRTVKGHIVRPFQSFHVIPTQGYGVWSTKRKLLPGYLGLPGQQIRQLREEGIEVSAQVEVPEVAWTSDTRIDVVESEAVVREAKLLIMEATFLDDRVSRAEAWWSFHTHLDDIAELARLFSNKEIILTYFSMRYTQAEAMRLVQKKLPKTLLERVRFLPDA